MKKGFTLIELLAVILILGIIALIAIPTVNNILKESRRGAFSSTLNNLEKAVEQQCTLEQIKNIDITNTYTITDGKISPRVEIKGDLPDGVLYVNDECSVGFTLFNSNFTGVKKYNSTTNISDKKLYTENILNGAIPVLSHGLIPVTIENDGTVKKADIFKKWYSYEEKKWANAVILTDSGQIEDDGTILEDSIESYFVWIPRYKYKLFDMGNYNSFISEKIEAVSKGPIDIIFENKNTDVSTGTAVGQYHSHPAFNDFDVNGLWVGKFETTGTFNNITTKPNQVSLKNLNIKNMFELILSYNKKNISHMIKNTEWGAVAYLSLSNYGINKEININNNSNYMTGYSAVSETYGTDASVTLPYNTEIGYKASTTGNITGIYDMSGGSYDMVSAYMDQNYVSGGFTKDPILIYGNKYFNKYGNNSSTTRYNNRILGDATGELGPFYYDTSLTTIYINSWYNDHAYFIDNSHPWFCRGNDFDDTFLAGQLSFDMFSGENANHITSRIVLAP